MPAKLYDTQAAARRVMSALLGRSEGTDPALYSKFGLTPRGWDEAIRCAEDLRAVVDNVYTEVQAFASWQLFNKGDSDA